MPRTKDDPTIRNRTNRAKLAPRKEPYWLTLEKGRALGYYKGEKGGTWVARYYDPAAKPVKSMKALGPADDFSDADGKMVLSFAQAQEAAREWFKVAFHEATGERVNTGGYTVRAVVQDYLDERERNGAKTAKRMKWDFEARILPELGEVLAEKLTRRRIEAWMHAVASSPARHRGKEAPGPDTPEDLRARRATANRLWTMLRAALNLAHRDRKIPSNAGWKDVAPFRGVQASRLRFLSPVEQQRFVNAAPTPDFRRLLQAGLFTGARESELAALRCSDFDPVNGSVFIATSKSGKPRHITLTSEAAVFFSECAAGLSPDAYLCPRASYERRVKAKPGTWSRAEVCRLMAKTCEEAQLEPLVFHELRHTYASGLVNAGMPLVFVAQQLGHRDSRMVEEHYGHLSPTAKTEAIRRLAPVLGIYHSNGVQSLEIKKG
jgi:integrase